MGVFRDSESPSAEFRVRNAGETPLKIAKIMKTCGCAEAAADRDALGPGETAAVRVTVEPYTLEGAFSKSVFVLTDPAGAQPLRLTVTGQCVPLFAVKPFRTVDTGRLPNGASWECAFEIEAAGATVLGPRGRKLDPEHLRITPALEGLSVRATTEPGGGLSAVLTVSPALARRLAENGPIKLTAAVPDAAPAPLTLQTAAPASGQR
ncbi:MAG: DUF1573 domain-containing protein [Lentisphaerae bacterium]|nr:DUF1573 domain-containing protein [Lentisphaerota bacterium]